MWNFLHGSWPELGVLHHCDTPACVRPDCLFLGTPADNARDREFKGRNAATKLTPEDVASIKAMKGLCTQAVLAERFGVSRSRICTIQRS
jgi:hypothetical protein